jgi:uncharacterized protein (DUF1501 family)
MTTAVSRRAFLRCSAALGFLGPVATPFALQLAAMNGAAAQSTPPDYKALVCIFMFGGNDGHNAVLATDTDSWTRYFAARNIGADQIALMPPGTPPAALGSISQWNGRTVTRTTPEYWGGVLPITPATPQPIPAGTNATVRTFALHPMLAPLQTLFTAKRLAVLANVGTLITPTTKAQYNARSVPLPMNLYSHNDQQSEWQAGAGEGARFGWGGRMADYIYTMNGQNSVFTAMSVAGNAVFLAGQNVVQYQVSTGAAPAVLISAATGSSLFGSSIAPARMQSIIRDTSGPSLFMVDYSTVVQRSMDSAINLNAAFTGTAAQAIPAPPSYTNPLTGLTEVNTLAIQMQTVAKMIATNTTLGMRRQVFFVSLGGFDTHQFENTQQPNLLAKVAQAMSYFDGALSNVGGVDMRPSVTAFTASDFNRTFTTNGSGTDHAWGSHHFILGGAAKGGDMFGVYPTLGVDSSSFQNPNMVGNALIPTTSVDQYGATLGRWFGVDDTSLSVIFPNLHNFSPANLAFV